MFGMKTGPAKLAKELPELGGEFIHRGKENYQELFEGVKNDGEMMKTGLINDYKGN